MLPFVDFTLTMFTLIFAVFACIFVAYTVFLAKRLNRGSLLYFKFYSSLSMLVTSISFLAVWVLNAFLESSNGSIEAVVATFFFSLGWATQIFAIISTMIVFDTTINQMVSLANPKEHLKKYSVAALLKTMLICILAVFVSTFISIFGSAVDSLRVIFAASLFYTSTYVHCLITKGVPLIKALLSLTGRKYSAKKLAFFVKLNIFSCLGTIPACIFCFVTTVMREPHVFYSVVFVISVCMINFMASLLYLWFDISKLPNAIVAIASGSKGDGSSEGSSSRSSSK